MEFSKLWRAVVLKYIPKSVKVQILSYHTTRLSLPSILLSLTTSWQFWKSWFPCHQSFQRYTPWWTTQLSLSHPVSTFHALIILLIKATFNCVFVVLVVAPESKRPSSKRDELGKPSMDEFRNKRTDFILCLFIQTLNNKAKMMHFEKITTSTRHELFLPSQNSAHFRASGLRPLMPLRVLLVTIYRWLFPWARLPWWLSGKESTCQCRRCGFEPQVGKIPWRRKWQPTPVFLPEKPYRQRSLGGYSPWVSKDSDMT